MEETERHTTANLIPSLTSGIVVGAMQVTLAISFAALIFSGPLAVFLAQGIGYLLVGALVVGTVTALFAPWPGSVGGNQEVPAAILALIATAIAAAVPATAGGEQAFLTVVAAMAITALVSGLFFFGMGAFRLGDLIRFLPYPVVGGFLAGTGWLLLSGAISLMAGLPLEFQNLTTLFQPQVLLRWLPGAVLAVVFLVVNTRVTHFLALPAMLLAALLLFFGLAYLNGYSVQELSAGGWLLGPFAGSGRWQPLTIQSLSQVHWPAILQQTAAIAAVALVSAVSLLLNASGLELAIDSDIDFDKELRVSGVANILAGLVAGMLGYRQLGFSVLNYRLKSVHRLSGLVAVGVCALTLVAGVSLLALFPKIIVGALLFLLGITFLVEWVIDGWSEMPKVDYAIVITILLITAVVGFLQAVAVGLLLALILFVVGYSRVDVVRHELDGVTFRSRVVRPRSEELFLRQYGNELYILQLQGFIFFGTAQSVRDRVRQRLLTTDLPHPIAIILDFEHVTGLDSTAMISLLAMARQIRAEACALVICGVKAGVRDQLAAGGLLVDGREIYVFNDIDLGLTWCEERLLMRHVEDSAATEQQEDLMPLLRQQMTAVLQGHFGAQRQPHARIDARIATMITYLERLDLEEGTVFITQGQPADTLYFLAAGRVTTRLNLAGRDALRLETVGAGHMVGELGFFLRGPRTADVLTDEPSVLFRLTRAAMDRMEAENPQAAALLYNLTVSLLAERVLHLTDNVRALER